MNAAGLYLLSLPIHPLPCPKTSSSRPPTPTLVTELSIPRQRRVAALRARRSGTDLKSDPLDLSDSSRESSSIGFHKATSLESSAPNSEQLRWMAGLEALPKRWVIVIMCFSSFLLCNMDRVGLFLSIEFKLEFMWIDA